MEPNEGKTIGEKIPGGPPGPRRWVRPGDEHRPASDAPPPADFPVQQAVHAGTTPQGGLVEKERGEGAAEAIPDGEEGEIQRFQDRFAGPGASGFRSGQDLLLPHERARLRSVKPPPIAAHPRTAKKD